VQAVQVKRDETDGYTGVQLGAGLKKLKRVNRPEAGHLDKAGVMPKRKLWEFRCTPDAIVEPGARLSPHDS
jgi:large subunit ribosomal protein L3